MQECNSRQQQLADYAVGSLRGRARARLEAHLADCPACQAELAALQRTGQILDAVGLDQAPAATWEAVRRDVLAAPRLATRSAPRLVWRFAVGALALIFIGLGVFFARPTVPPAAPPLVVTAEVDDDVQAAMEAHLSAVWASPLADEAAIGLRLASLEGGS